MSYTINITDDRWRSLYEKMRADGISNAKIDSIDGATDKVITDNGVTKAALVHAERYAEFMKKTLSREISWTIDEKTKKAVRTIATMVRNALARLGYTPGEKECTNLLAESLYLFAFAPDPKKLEWLKKNDPEQYDLFTLDTRFPGFEDVANYIIKNGGLGLSENALDAQFEATAKETLASLKGLCTERSKVLFAVFKEAGLNPFFAHMKPDDFYKNWPKMYGLSNQPPPNNPDTYFGGHVFVGIPNGDDPVYFEPNTIFPDADYGKYARKLPLREMYQIDMSNLAYNITRSNNRRPDPNSAAAGQTAEKLVEGAVALGNSPSLAYVYCVEGAIALQKNDYISAIRSYEKALELDPKHEQARIQICNILGKNTDLTGAVQCFEKLPDDATVKPLGLAFSAFKSGDYEKARTHYLRALELGANPFNVQSEIAKTYTAEKNFAKAGEHLSLALKEKKNSTEIMIRLAETLSSQKKWQEAADILKGALILAPLSRKALYLMTNAHINLNSPEPARKYFYRYLMTFTTQDPPLKELSDTMMEKWFEMAEKLGTWFEIEAVLNDLDRGGISTIATSIFSMEAMCRQGKSDEIKEPFDELLDLMLANSTTFVLTSAQFKHLAVLAGCTDRWAKLAKICEGVRISVPYFNIIMLHAAVKSGNDEIIQNAANLASAWIDAAATALPKYRSVDFFREIHAVIESLPPGIGSNEKIKPVIARYLKVIAETYEANGDKSSAEKAYTQAKGCGL